MITFSIKTKKGRKIKKISINCINCYEELTLAKWVELTKYTDDELDMFRLFSVFSGVSHEWLMSCKQQGLEEIVYNGVQWYVEDTVKLHELDVPEHIIIQDISVPIPESIGDKTLGQKFMLNKYVKNGVKIEDALPVILAIYLEPEYRIKKVELETGKLYKDFTDEEIQLTQWSEENTLNFVSDCENVSVLYAYPVSVFFLNSRKSWRVFGVNVSNPFKLLAAKRGRQLTR